MTSSELNKIIKSYKDTLKNRETEVERAKKEWSKYPEINISSYAEVD
ncbi:hypothetical protein HOG21_02000 [bacterium]|nr:hypothetical protein [bacterium]